MRTHIWRPALRRPLGCSRALSTTARSFSIWSWGGEGLDFRTTDPWMALGNQGIISPVLSICWCIVHHPALVSCLFSVSFFPLRFSTPARATTGQQASRGPNLAVFGREGWTRFLCRFKELDQSGLFCFVFVSCPLLLCWRFIWLGNIPPVMFSYGVVLPSMFSFISPSQG